MVDDWDDIADYVKNNYPNYKRFYITKSSGQPYIFLLFYLQYPPEIYQKESLLSTPDEYGFGQVEKFDKFIFDLPKEELNNSVVVGFPDDFSDSEKPYLKEIKIGRE